MPLLKWRKTNRNDRGRACLVAVAALIALARVAAPTTAEEPQRKLDERIVCVVVLKPGETKDLTLSSSCMRVTRGQGLLLREMGPSPSPTEKEWNGGGITASFVQVEQEDELAALKDAKLKSFIVRVTASKDAKPQLRELHVADLTCAGQCSADIRVLVVAP